MSAVGRVAVVTGGSGGIGSAVVAALEATGHTTIVLDLTVRREADIAVDLADEAAVRAAARQVLETHGRCDVLVHVAAALDQMDLGGLDLAVLRHVQSVNVEAALVLAQELAPSMAQAGFGRIVLVTSDTVWSAPSRALLAYVASKGALTAAARVLARTLGPDGVSVVCVAPGLTATPAARAGMPQEAFDAVLAGQALTRTLVPEDVAATVAYAVTDGAAALTGQTLVVDGGLVLR